MKEVLKDSIRFIILLILIFFIFFIIIFLFNIFPLLKIPKSEILLKEFFKSIVFPSFFYSFFNSFIVVIAINTFSFLKKQKKFKIIGFFSPILSSGVIVFFVLYFVSIDVNRLNLFKIDDLRLFFTPYSLFDYEYPITQSFNSYDFEKKILNSIDNPDDKIFLSKLYYKDLNSGDYILKHNLNFLEKKRFYTILYSCGYFDRIKLYFFGENSIHKNIIDRLILIDKNDINFFTKIKAEFIEDRFFLIFPDRKLEFYKEHFKEYNIFESFISSFLNKIGRIPYIFLEHKNPFVNTILFIGLLFFIQSFISLISFKEYRFIAFMINFIFIFFFLVYSYDIMIIFINFLKIFIEKSIIIQIIEICIFFIIGLLLNILNFLFFKTGIWESD